MVISRETDTHKLWSALLWRLSFLGNVENAILAFVVGLLGVVNCPVLGFLGFGSFVLTAPNRVTVLTVMCSRCAWLHQTPAPINNNQSPQWSRLIYE
jgi:hypothetical protein